MKKFTLTLSFLGLLSIFAFGIANFSPNALPGAKADDRFKIDGDYSVSLNGNTPGPTGFIPAAIVGQISFNGSTASGSRVLTVGGSPTPIPATFACNITEMNPNGTGVLSCDVNENNAPIPLRRDTFRIVVTDKGNQIELLFLEGQPLVNGVPPIIGAVITGTAKKQ